MTVWEAITLLALVWIISVESYRLGYRRGSAR